MNIYICIYTHIHMCVFVCLSIHTKNMYIRHLSYRGEEVSPSLKHFNVCLPGAASHVHPCLQGSLMYRRFLAAASMKCGDSSGWILRRGFRLLQAPEARIRAAKPRKNNVLQKRWELHFSAKIAPPAPQSELPFAFT